MLMLATFLSGLSGKASAASMSATTASGRSGSGPYLTHCASRRSIASPASFSVAMWRDMRDCVAPSSVIAATVRRGDHGFDGV
jgi:hypothetical protein